MKRKLDYYRYKRLRDNYELLVSRFANLRMFLFIVMLISFIVKYYYYEVFFSVLFIISLIAFIVMVMVYDKYFKIYNYYDKYMIILDNYIARDNGEWRNFKDTGSDFLSDANHFFDDLDILGNSSLFQYLSVCNTLGGRERLVNKLSNLDVDKGELEKNQNLIKELSNDILFCIKFQVMLDFYKDKKIHLSKDLDSFNNVIDCGKDILIFSVTSVICVILMIIGVLGFIPLEYFYGMFVFNLSISFLYVYIYKDDFIAFDNLINSYGKLDSLFRFISNYNGICFKMKKIIEDMKAGLEGVDKLKELDNVNSLRNNLISSFLLNGLFCFNLLVRIKYSKFLKNYFGKLRAGILDIEELEAMISLATIGIVKKDICMPVINEKLVLKFNNLKHPLIAEELCVSNDFSDGAGVNIITGSNMGGKTTFLRTMGINLILMQAGTYVCSEYFEASYFKIFTSMRVMDNSFKGISTFYGELLRIKDMIEYNEKGNMLVLIDEIFKGTNYNDRIYGAKEVVKRFNNRSTIVFITTHDFELCDSANVHNYHVREEYEGDKIVFDYKVRKGKCTTTNARYLMKKLDIVN